MSAVRTDIDLWVTRLDSGGDLLSAEQILAPDELQRAAAFRFPHLRRRYIARHVFLRTVIGSYLHMRPSDVPFTYGKNGKPEVPGETSRLHFNLAHSEEIAVLAVTFAASVGVDVEYVRDIDMSVASLFDPAESEELARMPGDKRAFYHCWTLKEAVIKATGEGLSRPLNSFAVSVDPREPPRLKRLDGGDPAEWSLYSFQPAEGYIGAAAVRQPNISVKLCHGLCAMV